MNKLLILIFTVILITSCNNKKDSQKDIIQSDFDFAASQLTFAMSEVDKGLVLDSIARIGKDGKRPLVSPRSIDEEGNLILVPSRDWTSGFFPGEIWYMYEYTKDPKWEQAARKYTAPIEREKINGVTHDMGFKVYCSFGNGYRLTKDEKYKEILLESAYTLTTRYKPNAKIIRSWEHSRDKWDCPVIIDN
ncbi:MAG: glucuronyl hydrolase, partial [Dysgonomonas sp.]|nr:glucuronyl hydrolase [Dysgonomonas sp.]